MFDRIKRIFGRESFEDQVMRLAKEANLEAIRLFESGDLGWTKGVLLSNGGQHGSATHKAVKEAKRGCLLGGIGKAAWIVTGKPSPEDERGWLLKEYVEAAGMELAWMASRDRVHREPYSYNDDETTTLDDVIDNVLKPSLDMELDGLPKSNYYSTHDLPAPPA